MKRIKVIVTLFIMFSASLMNYHDHSVSSVNFCKGSELVMCADSKNLSKNPSPASTDYRVKEITPYSSPEIEDPGVDQTNSPGKNYETIMVIM